METSGVTRPASERIVSLDALRGFDMFWIIGADALVNALHQLKSLSDVPAIQFAARHLEHVEWEGMVFYDLIFPLFVFMSGVSIPLALGKRLQRGDSLAKVHGHVFRRALVLYLLGVFYYGGLANYAEDIRWVGVLQRIALCYLGASLIYLHFRAWGQAVWTVLLLAGYWAAMRFVPFPAYESEETLTGVLTPINNLAAHVDRVALPGRAWFTELGGWDPEGILSTFPAITSCVLGVLAGQLLLRESMTPAKKVAVYLFAGILLVVSGYAWAGEFNEMAMPATEANSTEETAPEGGTAAEGQAEAGNAEAEGVAAQPPKWQFPIIKNIWTSSYVLVAGGYSLVLLGLFYLVVDIWKFRAWALPFIVIGVNPIFIYMCDQLVRWDTMAERLAGGHIADALGEYTGIVQLVIRLGLEIAVLWWMYRKRIFIRV